MPLPAGAAGLCCRHIPMVRGLALVRAGVGFLLFSAVSRVAAADPVPPIEAVATDIGNDLEAKLREARQLHLPNPPRPRTLAEEPLARARARHDHRNEAIAHVELGIALRRQNQNGLALQHLRDALAIVETLGDRTLLKRTLKEVGHTYWALSDGPNATDYFQRALRLCEEDGDINGQSDAHAGLGSVASHLGDTARERAEKELALKLAEQGGDVDRVGDY